MKSCKIKKSEGSRKVGIFATGVCDKGLISKIYRALSQMFKNTSHSPVDKWSKDMDSFQRKKLKLSIVIWKNVLNHYWLERCNQKTLRYHITPVRLANMTKQEDDKCWRKCGTVGTLTHWWSCELIQPLWRAIWNYAQRATKMCIPFDPSILLLGLYPKEIIKMGKGPTCTKIFIVAPLVLAKNWKSRRCPSVGEWLTKLWNMNLMEYYCAIRNDEQEDFREA